MNHPAELALHQYLEDAVNGKTSMSDTTIQQVATDVAEAMQRQFGGEKSVKTFVYVCRMWGDQLVSYGMTRTSLRKLYHFLQHSL